MAKTNTTLFQSLTQEFYDQGYRQGDKKTIKWFQKRIEELRKISRSRILGDSEQQRGSTMIGKMYFFNYDPKHKKTLPYYDRYPLIFPFAINKKHKGFYGINLHYLAPRSRSILFNKLMKNTRSSKTFSSTMRLRLNYDVISESTKYREIAPAIKMYLASHVRSKFLLIEPIHWPIALFLPIASFAKASEKRVWAESNKQIIGQM